MIGLRWREIECFKKSRLSCLNFKSVGLRYGILGYKHNRFPVRKSSMLHFSSTPLNPTYEFINLLLLGKEGNGCSPLWQCGFRRRRGVS